MAFPALNGLGITCQFGRGNYGKGQRNTQGRSTIESGPQPGRGNVSRDLVLSASTRALIHDKAAEMVDVRIYEIFLVSWLFPFPQNVPEVVIRLPMYTLKRRN